MEPTTATRKPHPGGWPLRLLRDRRAATAVEYGFVIALVVIVMVAAVAEVGNATSSMWNDVNTKVTNAH